MMMKNYDELVEINQNPNGPHIINYPYRSLNIGYSGSGKTNVLPNLITKNQWLDIDQIYLYIKDPSKSKYQLLNNGREKVGLKELKNPKTFISYSQITDYVYKNLIDYNTTKKSFNVWRYEIVGLLAWKTSILVYKAESFRESSLCY